MGLFYFEKPAPGPEIQRRRLRVNMDAVKRFFGIRSPSEVYRGKCEETGRIVCEGLQAGLQAGLTPNAEREAAGLLPIDAGCTVHYAVPLGGDKLGEYFPQVITCPRCGHETIDMKPELRRHLLECPRCGLEL